MPKALHLTVLVEVPEVPLVLFGDALTRGGGDRFDSDQRHDKPALAENRVQLEFGQWQRDERLEELDYPSAALSGQQPRDSLGPAPILPLHVGSEALQDG